MYDYPNVSDLHTKLPLASPICEEGLCKGPARNQRGDMRIPSRNAFATMNRLRTGIEISDRSDEGTTSLLERGNKGHGSIAQLEYSWALCRSAMRPMEIGGGSVMSIESCGESGSSEKFCLRWKPVTSRTDQMFNSTRETLKICDYSLVFTPSPSMWSPSLSAAGSGSTAPGRCLQITCVLYFRQLLHSQPLQRSIFENNSVVFFPLSVFREQQEMQQRTKMIRYRSFCRRIAATKSNPSAGDGAVVRWTRG
jgi:hypothetical protein